MKTKKILGLGICALSLGMVAGVIGTRAAVEAKAADLEYVKLHIKTSAAGDYTDYVMTDQGTGAAGTSAASYAYTIEVEEGAEFTVFYKWSDGSDTWCDNKYGASIAANWSPAQGTSAENKNAIYSGTTKTFKITAVNPHSNWVDLKIEDASEKVDVTVKAIDADGNPIAGIPDKVHSVNKGEAYVLSEGAMGYTLVGYKDSDKTTAITQVTPSADKTVYAVYSPVETAKTYYFSFKKAAETTDFQTPANYKIYAWKTDVYPEWPGDITLTKVDGADYVYKANLTTDVEKIIINEKVDNVGAQTVDITLDYEHGYDYYLLDSKNDEEQGTESGKWTVSPSYFRNAADGYYLTGSMNDWGFTLKGTASGANKAIWTGVSLAKDVEFKVVGIDNYAATYYNPAPLGGAKDNFEVVDNIKVDVAGVYNFYFTNDNAIYVELTSAEDKTAVDNFVATYITAKAGEPGEGDTCAAKEAAALAAYADLTDNQKELFNGGADYASARATLQYWHDHKTDNTASYSVSGLATNNPTLIITISVIAGAAVAGAGIYLISKKRKHN